MATFRGSWRDELRAEIECKREEICRLPENVLAEILCQYNPPKPEKLEYEFVSANSNSSSISLFATVSRKA